MSEEEQVFAGPCCKCKTGFYLPKALHDAARKSANITFYCPYGHPQVYREGETDLIKMRRRAERAEQRNAQKDDAITVLHNDVDTAKRQTAAAKGQVTKLKNRASAGVCICCNRTFQNLAKHMQSKHPDVGITKPLKVIAGGKPE